MLTQGGTSITARELVAFAVAVLCTAAVLCVPDTIANTVVTKGFIVGTERWRVVGAV